MQIDAEEIYQKLKCHSRIQFQQDIHCPLIIKTMANPKKGRFSAFCVDAGIGESKFYEWLKHNPIFRECYEIGKMLARENWEIDGERIAEEVHFQGSSNHAFEHWRMMGWSRYGIGKNARIRLDLNCKDSPDQHYAQLLYQASQGDFTAGEIKQLMEAVNVGLNTHQVFKLQKEIDQLKFDLTVMNENSNGNDSVPNKRVTEKD